MAKLPKLHQYKYLKGVIRAAPLDEDHQKDILDVLFYLITQNKITKLQLNDESGSGVYTISYRLADDTNVKTFTPNQYLIIFNDGTIQTTTNAEDLDGYYEADYASALVDSATVDLSKLPA